MKRILFFVILLSMALTVTACGPQTVSLNGTPVARVELLPGAQQVAAEALTQLPPTPTPTPTQATAGGDGTAAQQPPATVANPTALAQPAGYEIAVQLGLQSEMDAVLEALRKAGWAPTKVTAYDDDAGNSGVKLWVDLPQGTTCEEVWQAVDSAGATGVWDYSVIIGNVRDSYKGYPVNSKATCAP